MSILRRVDENIWIADGPSVRFFVAGLTTRMILVKLGDGTVWINSPVPMSSEVLSEIATIGPVRHLVAPTPLHVWRLQEARQRFPQAQLWGPPKGVPPSWRREFSGTLSDDAPEAWSRDLDQVAFAGNLLIEEVEFFHKESGTLIVADFIQNHAVDGDGTIARLLKRIGGVDGCGVPLDIRLSFVQRQRARRSLQKLLAWDFDRLIVAHGSCIDRNAKAAVRRAFRWLELP